MNNPYTAPTSTLQEAPPDLQFTDKNFYIVSKVKFYTLFAVTLGSYLVYWSYQNWRQLKTNAGVKCWPAPRGLFFVFFIHGMMKHVSAQAESIKYNISINLHNQATTAVVLIVVNHILDRLTAKNIGFPIVDLISIAILIPMGISIWTMQNVINAVSGDAEGNKNSKFTVANYIWIVLGILMWGFLIWNLLQGRDPNS
jgi:hypothetical protein